MDIKRIELQQVYKEMKKDQPDLTVDEFIEYVREYNESNLQNVDFKKYAVNMLLSTREVVKAKPAKEEKKQPVQLGQ